MDDRARYERVKSRLRVLVEGTAQQVHESMDDANLYSIREIVSTLDELIVHEKAEFEKVGDVYRWTRHYRFRAGENLTRPD